MLIRLADIESAQELAEALAHPTKREDGILYVTSAPAYAKALIRAGLSCVFLESGTEAEHLYGADLVIQADADSEEDSAKADRGEESNAKADCGKEDSGRTNRERADSGRVSSPEAGIWRRDMRLLENVWKRHYHLPWEIAQTERLLIRETVMEDLPQLLELYEEERENPDVKPFSDQPQKELAAYIQNRYPFYGYGLWTVLEKSSGRVVGRVGFQEVELPELSYLIGRAYRGRGYGTEAARAVLTYAGEQLGFSRVLLRTSLGNTPSKRLAAKLGFQKEAGAPEEFYGAEPGAERHPEIFKIDLTSR